MIIEHLEITIEPLHPDIPVSTMLEIRVRIIHDGGQYFYTDYVPRTDLLSRFEVLMDYGVRRMKDELVKIKEKDSP